MKSDRHELVLSMLGCGLDGYEEFMLRKLEAFEESPRMYEEGFQVYIGDYPLAVYQHGRQYYNSAHSIIIVEQQSDGCEIYIFATASKHEKTVHYLANNIDILYHFILYLKDKGLKLLVKANQHKLQINQKQKANKQIKIACHEHEKQNIKQQFFRATHVYKYQLKDGEHAGVILTDREIDCIYHLVNHKTAEQTAKLLGVSRRTIESYLDNIKLKLCCDSKVEIIRKLASNRYVNALRYL